MEIKVIVSNEEVVDKNGFVKKVAVEKHSVALILTASDKEWLATFIQERANEEDCVSFGCGREVHGDEMYVKFDGLPEFVFDNNGNPVPYLERFTVELASRELLLLPGIDDEDLRDAWYKKQAVGKYAT